MSRKKLSLGFLILICIILIVSYTILHYNAAKITEENQPQDNPADNPEVPQDNPADNPEGPLLVIPETPVGTLGLISALAGGFGTFTIMKKRR